MVMRRIRNFMEAGQRMQEQAMAMHLAQQAVEGGGGAGGGGVGGPGRGAEGGAPAWDPARHLPAPSAFVKRVTCGSCGAPKQLPTVRQHL